MKPLTQSCPNCQAVHDVTVYVSGQRVLCRCGIRFEVRRTDVSSIGRAPVAAPPVEVDVDLRPSVVTMKAAPIKLDLEAEDRTYVRGTEGGPAAAADGQPLEIPGYVLEQILGRGGMGEVWRAHQVSLGRTVAVKLLPPKLAKDPEFVARFEKEATALASLSHPNIIQIIDRGVAGDHYYFVMEFVPGRSLRDVMNAGRLSANDALRIIGQICQAIDYAHDKDIIHRDLKPENILIDERGHVKVADFGLAGIRGTEPKLQLTATAVAMGTVNYMAPEQRRDAKNVDGRADLYSLGVMLYELLTGELPIGRFKLPSEKIAGLDVRIDEIVVKTLETDPGARYARASQVGSAIDALIGSVPRMSGDSRPPLPASSTTTPRSPRASFVQTGWWGLRRGLSVVGALALIGFGIRLAGWRVGRTAEGSAHAATPGDHLAHGHAGDERLPENTDGDLYTDFQLVQVPGKKPQLQLAFSSGVVVPNGQTPDAEATLGKEKINAHAGDWAFVNGKLHATQAGDQVAGNDLKLIPRAYLAKRYYSSNDFSAEVEVTLEQLEACFPHNPDASSFGELSFRIKDFFVSAMAIQGTGMRLGWKYTSVDRVPVQGNSSEDIAKANEDETPLPPAGTPFRLGLRTEKRKGGTLVSATINGRVYASKFLVGLDAQTAKVALGCRNLHCQFDGLVVSGANAPKPAKEVAHSE